MKVLITGISGALARLASEGIAPPSPESRARYAYPGIAEQMGDAVELAIAKRARPV